MALYVYGLMRTREGTRAAEAGSVSGAPLHTVEQEGLSALVSEIGEGDVVLRRRSALNHSDTLQAAYKHGPVLPVRFGTVLADATAVKRDLLAPQAEAFLRRLDALEGLAEMQVKAEYLEEPLLRSILTGSPRLEQSAARIRGRPAAATHFEQVALGEAIAGQLQERRQADADAIAGQLEALSLAALRREPGSEYGVLNSAYLVETGQREAFDTAVERLSQEQVARMRFKLIGPMPAYSFADQPWEERLAQTGGSRWG